MTRKPPYDPAACPKCGTASPCTEWKEVDIGVGVQYGDPEYSCPSHGNWTYLGNGVYAFQDDYTSDNGPHFSKAFWDVYTGMKKGKLR